jgi:outer membrane lipoprotein-sorting protein
MSFSQALKACSILAALLTSAGTAATPAEILARMDLAAAKFHQMTADVTRTTYTAVLNDKSVESGTVRMLRLPTGEVQGLEELTAPDHKFYSFEKRTLRIYTPQIKTVQVFDLGQYGEQLDQFLSIGFGTSGKELAKTYGVEVAADNKVPQTTLVRLTPRDPEVTKHLKKIDLWITDENYPVREKLWEPSGDWILVTYSNVQLNQKLSSDAFTLKLPPGTKTEHPQE